LGVFSGDEAISQQAFLSQTNAILNDADVDNDVSFQVSSVGGISNGAFQPYLILSDLKKDEVYQLKFYVFSDRNALLVIKNQNTLSRINNGNINIKKGANVVETLWHANGPDGILNISASSSVHIYGYAIELVKNL
jgi:hypothetical protein